MFIKIKQSLNLQAFAALKEQAAKSGVHVVTGRLGDRVTAEHVVGQVGKTMFNIKGRIEVDMGGINTKDKTYAIDKVGTVYYVRQL